jgi:hypothetical protein
VIISEITRVETLWEESGLKVTEVRKRVLGHISLEAVDSVDSAPCQIVKTLRKHIRRVVLAFGCVETQCASFLA